MSTKSECDVWCAKILHRKQLIKLVTDVMNFVRAETKHLATAFEEEH